MATTPPPKTMIQQAFDRLKKAVTSNDALVFQSTTLEDVWKAADEIQKVQRQRQSLRNMNRIKPLLDIFEKYSRVVEVLCNGTPYLPWVWAPIKLMLQLASGYTSVFDQLIDAYAQIAEAMPHFDRLQSGFNADPNFQAVLGMVYSDILEFHRRAYKFFRRRAWHIFFDSLWKSFETRFNGILESLARHKDLVTKEAIGIDLVEARRWRARAEEDLKIREKRRTDTYTHDAIAWLNVASEHQDDELDRLLGKRQEGTCNWIFRNAQMTAWKDDVHSNPVLWIKGIPGAGKTILCTYLIHCIQQDSQATVAYYICNSYTNGKNLLAEMFRSITVQLLRANLELAPYVFENYASKQFSPSAAHLRRLLPELLSTIPTTRICIDGLDEYPENEQRLILQELLSLAKMSNGHCRILISSREVPQINRLLRNKPTISFRDENAGLGEDIRSYVDSTIGELGERFNQTLVDDVRNRVVAKANGMFLWVRLVALSLQQCHSVQELKTSLDMLPEGLEEAYGRILHRVMNELGARESPKAMRILEWLACSFRTLKVYEIQDGIAFHTESPILNEDTKLPSTIIDLCKPLIEEGPKNTVDFVHYSAKEYILHETSGPFLMRADAHYDITFSCITYLNTANCFRDTSISERVLRLRVVKAFHGLHYYANEFWFQHLLQYANCSVNLDDNHLLESALEELLKFWKAAPGLASESLKLGDTTTADEIQSRVSALSRTPWVERMGLDVQMFRAHLTQEKDAHSNPESGSQTSKRWRHIAIHDGGTDKSLALQIHELQYDPTYFSLISQRYQKVVAFLLNCTIAELPQEVTPLMLNEFRATHSDSAFICRYRECDRHTDGFKSSAKRDEHESSHTKPLRCADPSCDFFARGFTSNTGLIKHNRRYHPNPEEKELPEFQPRKEVEFLEVLPPPVPPEPVPQISVSSPAPTAPPNFTPVNLATETIIKRRVRWGKKGLKVHNCEICGKIFTRAEGLRRHKLSHQRPGFICTYGDCGRAFHRPDLLDRHLQRHKLTDHKQILEQQYQPNPMSHTFSWQESISPRGGGSDAATTDQEQIVGLPGAAGLVPGYLSFIGSTNIQ